MLPLHAHGYLSGLSSSPGFLQILHTSSSSSSSSYFAAAAADDEEEGDALGSFSGADDALRPSAETPSSSGAACAISMVTQPRIESVSWLSESEAAPESARVPIPTKNARTLGTSACPKRTMERSWQTRWKRSQRGLFLCSDTAPTQRC